MKGGKLMSNSNNEKFNQSYDKYANMLYRIAYLHTGNAQESEDIMQDVFIKLLYNAPSFKNETHKKAWLIRVTTNKCKDYLKSSRHSNMSLNEEIISDKCYEDDKALDIQSKIIMLNDKYKTVVYLFYYEDYSIRQIASCLRITESTVKMRLKRAREILKKELKDYEEF